MKDLPVISKKQGAIITVCYLALSLFISISIATSLWYINDSIQNLSIELHQYTTVADTKTREMRVTGYTPTGNKTTLGEKVVVGYTAAISPNCADSFLGSKVYVQGLGVRYVNDLTATWVGEKYDMCTLDVAVPNNQEALRVGNEIKRVVRIP
jgi:3D (Asp-Asp-Asp) domain-containing protein